MKYTEMASANYKLILWAASFDLTQIPVTGKELILKKRNPVIPSF